MDIGWQQEVNIADSPIETGAKAPGPVLARPNILCIWGRDASIGLCDKGVKLAIARPSAFALLRAWVPRYRVLCLLFLAVCDPTCDFALPRFYSRLPRTLRSQFQGQSPNSSMFFSFASGFIRADLHKHDTVQSSNNNHKLLWSVCAIIETSKPGFSQGKTQAMLSLGRDEGPDNARVWGI